MKNPNQIRAAKMSIRLGSTLQTDLGESLRDLLVRGKSAIDVVKELNLADKYGVRESIAKAAVSRAYKGHDGTLGIERYDALIPDQTRLVLVREMVREKCKAAGKELFNNKKGTYARSEEDIRADGIKAGKLAAKARGFEPWEPEAIERAYILSQDPTHQYDSGPHRGSPNYGAIAETLVKENYPARTRDSVKVHILARKKLTPPRALTS